MNEEKKLSKFLSLILRHQPEIINLKLDEGGWADVEELIIKSQSQRIELLVWFGKSHEKIPDGEDCQRSHPVERWEKIRI